MHRRRSAAELKRLAIEGDSAALAELNRRDLDGDADAKREATEVVLAKRRGSGGADRSIRICNRAAVRELDRWFGIVQSPRRPTGHAPRRRTNTRTRGSRRNVASSSQASRDGPSDPDDGDPEPPGVDHPPARRQTAGAARERGCLVCGAPLEGMRHDARYCGPAHRREAARRRHADFEVSRQALTPGDEPGPQKRADRVALRDSAGTDCNPSDLAGTITMALGEAGSDPRSGFPRGFTYRELAQLVYGTGQPINAQLSALRRAGARLLRSGEAAKCRRGTEGVQLRRPMTPADHEARAEAMRRLRERQEAKRRATPYPVDAGYGGVVEVEVEPVLKITERGVELRETA